MNRFIYATFALFLGNSLARAEVIEVTASGVGLDSAAAEKAALISAVKQAVGAFMDAETLIENERVVYEKILTVSDGFVESYSVIGKPSRRFDGLYETTIRARVKKGAVGEVLAFAGLGSVSVDGRQLWAQSITKLHGAKDAYEALREKLPHLLTQMIDVDIRNYDGSPPRGGLAKPKTIENLTSETVSCTWTVLISTDRQWWFSEGAPFLEAAFRRLSSNEIGKQINVPVDENGNRQSIGEYTDDWRNKILLETATDRMRRGRAIRIFEFPEQTRDALAKLPVAAGRFHVVVEFSLLGTGGEILLRTEVPFPSGIVYVNYFGHGSYKNGTLPSEVFVLPKRAFAPEFAVDGGSGVDEFPLLLKIDVDPEVLRDARQAAARVKTIP